MQRRRDSLSSLLPGIAAGVALAAVPHLFALLALIRTRMKLRLTNYRALAICAVGTALMFTASVLGQSREVSWDNFSPVQFLLFFLAGSSWQMYRHAVQIRLGILAVLSFYAIVSLFQPSGQEFIMIAGIPIHENTWAARGAIALGLLGVLSGDRWLLGSAGAMSVLLAIGTGSRTAGATALIVLFVLMMPVRFVRPLLLVLAILVVGLNVGVLVGSVWRGPTVDLIRQQGDVNLLPSSEDLASSMWHREGVEVSPATDLSPSGHAAFRITKTDTRSDARPTTRVVLQAPGTYIVSFLIDRESSDDPGFRLWAAGTDGQTDSALDIVVLQDSVETRQRGNIEPVAVELLSIPPWEFVLVTFFVESPRPLTAFAGPVPSFEGGLGSSAMFAHIQIANCTLQNCTDIEYTPTFRQSQAWTAGVSRISAVGIALDGFYESPWFGSGLNTYSLRQASRSFTFAHSHNLIAQTLHDLGALGLFGLALFLAGLYWGVAKSPQGSLLLVSLLLLNTFDLTFWSGGVTAPAMIVFGALAAASGNGSGGTAAIRLNESIDQAPVECPG